MTSDEESAISNVSGPSSASKLHTERARKGVLVAVIITSLMQVNFGLVFMYTGYLCTIFVQVVVCSLSYQTCACLLYMKKNKCSIRIQIYIYIYIDIRIHI